MRRMFAHMRRHGSGLRKPTAGAVRAVQAARSTLSLTSLALTCAFWMTAAALVCGPQPLHAAEGELVAAFAPTELVLDPVHSYKTQELQLATAIYEGLVTYHPVSLKPMPALARTWEISDDGRVYRFVLRENGRYSNGDAVTAEDVRRSWLRILDPADQGEYSFLLDVIKGAGDYRTGRMRDPSVVGIRAVSDTVLEVELAEPAGHFLSMLCHMAFVPVYPGYQGRSGWDRTASIVGNGPFVMESRGPNEMILVKNPYYWDRDRVALERIRVLFIDDPLEITRRINSREIDWADDGDTGSLEDTDMIQLDLLFGTSYLFFRCGSAPWSDPRIRKGLALVLPLEELRQQFAPFGTDTLVPALFSYPEVEGLADGDEERGMALLAEAGYPNGRGLPGLVIKVPTGSGAENTARLLSSTWQEKLSVRVKIQTYPYDRYLEELENDDYTMGSTTWIGDFADPLAFLQIWTSGSNLNEAGYDSAEYDLRIEKAMAEPRQERYASLAEAEAFLLGEAVVIPLSHPPSFNLIDLDRVGGWYSNLMDIHPFKYMRFKVRRPPPDAASVD